MNRYRVTLVKAVRWSPDVLTPELSIGFAVFHGDALERWVSLSQHAALAIACFLLRTVDFSNRSGEVAARAWQLLIPSATLADAERRRHTQPDPDRSRHGQAAVCDLRGSGLTDLAAALAQEEARPIDTSLYPRAGA